MTLVKCGYVDKRQQDTLFKDHEPYVIEVMSEDLKRAHKLLRRTYGSNIISYGDPKQYLIGGGMVHAEEGSPYGLYTPGIIIYHEQQEGLAAMATALKLPMFATENKERELTH